jgi:hypothetical protein
LTISKPVKLLVGALSAWPFIYMFFFFGFIATSFFWMDQTAGRAGEPSSGIPIALALVFAAHFGTMLLIFGLLIFYIIYLFKTDRVPQDKKALWAAVLILGNMLAMPVFFYIYVRPDEWPKRTSGSPATQEGGTGA